MTHVWFAIAHFLQKTFDWFLVSLGWLPVTIITCTLAFGLLYWLNAQARFNRRAREEGGHM